MQNVGGQIKSIMVFLKVPYCSPIEWAMNDLLGLFTYLCNASRCASVTVRMGSWHSRDASNH